MLLTVWTTTAKSTYTHNGILRSYHMLFTRALTMTGLCLGPSFSQVWSSLVAQQIKNLPALQETLVWILDWEDPWRRDRLLTPVFMGFPGGSDGKESACNVGDLGLEDPKEKGTATHSSILAWRTAWTEEPDGLQSKGSQRVRHDWTTSTNETNSRVLS